MSGLIGKIKTLVDVNTIDYDIQHHVVDSDARSDEANNKTYFSSFPELLNRAHDNSYYRDKESSMLENKRNHNFTSTIFKTLSKGKLKKSSYKSSCDSLPAKCFNKDSRNIQLTLPNSTIFRAVNLTSTPRLSKTNDTHLKNVTIKKRSIKNESKIMKPSKPALFYGLNVLKRSDRGFKFTSSSEEVDPVSSIFDNEFMLGGIQSGHEGTTEFPIIDKDHDYNTDYDYTKSNNPSSEEYSGEDSTGENNDETYKEPNDEQEIRTVKTTESDKIKHKEKFKNKESKEKEEDEDEYEDEEDVVKEPPIIVLYKGGDSKQLQPSFEHALTHGGLDPRYIIKDPLAGPLATRGFNHHFQVMRGVPIQGNVVQPNRRYPLVAGFNTTQIHAIIQSGRFPPSTDPVGNNTAVGVKPPAPADEVRYVGRLVDPEQYEVHPPQGYSHYVMRPTSPPVIPYYYGRRGRRPSPYAGHVRSPSGLVMSTGPRYVPSYRGGRVIRYRGTRSHMARYRPINVGVPRGTRVAVMARRESTGSGEGSQPASITVKSDFGDVNYKDTSQEALT